MSNLTAVIRKHLSSCCKLPLPLFLCVLYQFCQSCHPCCIQTAWLPITLLPLLPLSVVSWSCWGNRRMLCYQSSLLCGWHSAASCPWSWGYPVLTEHNLLLRWFRRFPQQMDERRRRSVWLKWYKHIVEHRGASRSHLQLVSFCGDDEVFVWPRSWWWWWQKNIHSLLSCCYPSNQHNLILKNVR